MSDWRDDAACKDMETSIFFEGYQKMSKEEKLDLIATCEKCPVLKECYIYATSTKCSGFWASKEFRDGRAYNPLYVRKRDSLKIEELEVA